jgi:hypothetical protein
LKKIGIASGKDNKPPPAGPTRETK